VAYAYSLRAKNRKLEAYATLENRTLLAVWDSRQREGEAPAESLWIGGSLSLPIANKFNELAINEKCRNQTVIY